MGCTLSPYWKAKQLKVKKILQGEPRRITLVTLVKGVQRRLRKFRRRRKLLLLLKPPLKFHLFPSPNILSRLFSHQFNYTKK